MLYQLIYLAIDEIYLTQPWTVSSNDHVNPKLQFATLNHTCRNFNLSYSSIYTIYTIYIYIYVYNIYVYNIYVYVYIYMCVCVCVSDLS